MLVLRRNVKESLLIDGDIKITILAIEGHRVKIGVEAPADKNVVRTELIERPCQARAKV